MVEQAALGLLTFAGDIGRSVNKAAPVRTRNETHDLHRHHRTDLPRVNPDVQELTPERCDARKVLFRRPV